MLYFSTGINEFASATFEQELKDALKMPQLLPKTYRLPVADHKQPSSVC